MNQTSTEVSQEIQQLEADIIEKKQRLAELRQQAAPEKVEDYGLKGADGAAVKLSELFGDKNDLILIHNMGTHCPYCTMWADGFNGVSQYLEDRAGFAMVSGDAPGVQKAFAEKRGWTFRMVSGEGSTFIKDMGFEGEEHPQYGKFKPGVSVFHRNADGSMFRVASTWFGPGDDFCSVWHLFDLLRGGAGEWQPKFNLKK